MAWAVAPDGVVVGAVEHRRLGRAGGPDTGDLGGRRVWKRSRRGDLSLYDQQHAECGAQGFARGKDASLDTAGWRMVGRGERCHPEPIRCAQGDKGSFRAARLANQAMGRPIRNACTATVIAIQVGSREPEFAADRGTTTKFMMT